MTKTLEWDGWRSLQSILTNWTTTQTKKRFKLSKKNKDTIVCKSCHMEFKLWSLMTTAATLCQYLGYHSLRCFISMAFRRGWSKERLNSVHLLATLIRWLAVGNPLLKNLMLFCRTIRRLLINMEVSKMGKRVLLQPWTKKSTSIWLKACLKQ